MDMEIFYLENQVLDLVDVKPKACVNDILRRKKSIQTREARASMLRHLLEARRTRVDEIIHAVSTLPLTLIHRPSFIKCRTLTELNIGIS
jgi:hypothetical protein